jgi:hypothetical protein
MSDDKFMRDVVARIVVLARAETSQLRPTPDDNDLGATMQQIHNEQLSVANQDIVRAFVVASDEDHRAGQPRHGEGIIVMLEGFPYGTTLAEAVQIRAHPLDLNRSAAG